MGDPLAALLRDLERDGRPSLAWAIEHAPDGDVDAAIARAWEGCGRPDPLMRLLFWADRDDRHAAERAMRDERYRPPFERQWGAAWDLRMADVVRRVAAAPTLAELLTARASAARNP